MEPLPEIPGGQNDCQDGVSNPGNAMGRDITILTALISAAGGLLFTSPSLAAPYCTAAGVPAGCVGRPAMRATTPGAGAPGVGVTPGVGAGAPGVGVAPAAGPGVGPNAGGPVNRPGRR